MSRFYVFEESRAGSVPEVAKGRSVLDGLIDAAGGRPLPGRWGLLQALITTVSQPRHNTHPALHWSKTSLNVAGVFRAYRAEKHPEPVPMRDPVSLWLEERNMSTPPGLSSLSSLLLHYSADLPHEDLRFPNHDQEWLRVFKTSEGVEYVFLMWKGSSYYGGRDIGSGPYLKSEDEQPFLRTINRTIWDMNGNSDLELTLVNTGNSGPAQFSLGQIGTPDTYIGEDSDNVDASVARCLAFHRKGLTRNILFYGPPGTGKTSLARTIARGVGEGRTLRVEAKALARAGVNAVLGFITILRPRVILFDDMDRCMDVVVDLLHTLEQGGALQEMNAMLVGTVNVVEQVDPALLRPGRFDEVIEIAEPSPKHRTRIIQHYLAYYGLPAEFETSLVRQTDGFSPADVREVTQALSVVGVEHVEAEVQRVGRQRKLYSGGACKEYLERKNQPTKAALSSWKPYP